MRAEHNKSLLSYHDAYLKCGVSIQYVRMCDMWQCLHNATDPCGITELDQIRFGKCNDGFMCCGGRCFGCAKNVQSCSEFDCV